MKLQLYKFQCAKCGATFKAPELYSASYGEFLLRSIGSGREAHLDATRDKTYQEFNELIQSSSRVSGKSQNQIAEIVRTGYGTLTCDPDHAGYYYQIDASPKCPACGAQEVSYWEETSPPEIIEKTLRPVTHNVWDSFTRIEKKKIVDDYLVTLRL